MYMPSQLLWAAAGQDRTESGGSEGENQAQGQADSGKPAEQQVSAKQHAGVMIECMASSDSLDAPAIATGPCINIEGSVRCFKPLCVRPNDFSLFVSKSSTQGFDTHPTLLPKT